MIVQNLQTLLIIIAGLGIGVAALFGFRRVREENEESRTTYVKEKAYRPLSVAVAGLVLAASFVFVPAGYAGVVYDVNEGVLPDSLSEGVHLIIPGKQHVTNIDTRVTVFTHDIEDKYILTLDTQEVRVPIAINYNVADASFVREFIRGDIATTIVEPALLRELRTIVGQYQLERVAENQNEINILIEEGLTAHFEAHGLAVAYVSVLDVIPQRGIVNAIELEKIEERNLITAEHRRDIATLDAQALVELATGEARAIERLATAKEAEQTQLGMDAVQYVWFTRWNGMLPSTLLGNGDGFIVNLPAE